MPGAAQVEQDPRTMIADAAGAVPAVEDGPYLIATLPDPALNLGRMVEISNAYDGASPEWLIATGDVGDAYWVPLTPRRAAIALLAGGFDVEPLVVPELLICQGTLIDDTTIAFQTDNIWPGCSFELLDNGFDANGFTAAITGVAGSPAAYTGGNRRFVFQNGDWTEF